MSAAESNLWTEGKIGESGIVNSSAQTSFTAAPIGAGIECEAEPAIEVIGEADARASRIRFQAAAQRGHCSWKQAVHIGAGMEEGVSAEKFPFGSGLILRGRERSHATQDGNYCQQHNCNTATRLMRVR